jgi:hypothetical protein
MTEEALTGAQRLRRWKKQQKNEIDALADKLSASDTAECDVAISDLEEFRDRLSELSDLYYSLLDSLRNLDPLAGQAAELVDVESDLDGADAAVGYTQSSVDKAIEVLTAKRDEFDDDEDEG